MSERALSVQQIYMNPAVMTEETGFTATLPANKRVAAYCRVSTDSDGQQSSFDTQVSVFRDYILGHPGWELVDVYADEGITGTSVKKRPEFQRMLKDAEAGKIDLLLVKSISRFARNTVECLECVRLLQSYGTQLIFEKEGIDTGSAFSEMLLTVLAAFAQEESRSISENQKWAFRKKFEEGKPRWNPIYGYRKGDTNEDWIIVPEEAAIIHEAYDLYEHGESFESIAQKFNAKRYLPPSVRKNKRSVDGSYAWDATVISGILRNEKYIGDFLCQKRYVIDHLSHKQVKNDQTVIPSYYIRDHHAAIISRKQFERVHKIMDLKNRNLGPAQYPYDDKLVCPVCGKRMIQRRMQVLESVNSWICERDEKSCGMYALKAKLIVDATLEAYAAVNMAEVEERLKSVRKAQREAARMLIAMKKQHRKLKKVEYYWVDDLIDRITFGEEKIMTVHWKCGVKTTVTLDIRHRRENPVYIAEVYQRRKKEGTLPRETVLPKQPAKNITHLEQSKNA